ncbi:S-DNA-T family DNA segregation ATPase FtsK/SpoIIIE [Evansella vedderi]|uniref:S-DNA-T family DNA segregation ATPase FtsK/SpoIIIE n=1 Tax=Evansella vedderi TaxID=38282 RepID=A0ABT9ZUU9_9BACI|nr:DNA translocase FtsK [Evansella vedderi]MDQ0254989.1 S-DNA-T family DNA segregation ATPase FtsK/SpoIIIE [Evansella vedderi]
MSKVFPRLLLTLKEWLFPKEETSTKETKRQRTAHTYRNEPSIEARVIHQYPKQGNFRFPLVKDDELINQRPKVTVRKVDLHKESLRKQIDQQPNAKQPFKGTISPSPIYGYGTHPLNKQEVSMSNDIVEEETTEEEVQFVQHIEEVEVDAWIEENSLDILSEEKTAKSELAATLEEETTPTIEENKIPRSERRRLERLQQKMNKSGVGGGPSNKIKNINMKTDNHPYNVVMLSRDKIKEKKREFKNEKDYDFPALHLLEIPPKTRGVNDEWVTAQVKKLDETLDYFNIKASVVHVTKGPSVTRFEIQPQPGVKVSKITNLTDDLKLNLAAKEIRMEAPIPGKNTIGIEVPNDVSEPVFLRDILRHPNFLKAASPLTVALGKDIEGGPVVTDLQKMPHGLIAGATGSGKSVCVNSILVSLLYKATPKEVRLLLIDPKMVELAPYNGMPHLASPVITDPKEATEGLKWAVAEMDRRYELFAKEGTRDLKRYNEKQLAKGKEGDTLPYLVIVVDELADLMMVAPQDVEEAICRIAQKARACGIHLLVATQRPSVDVITGLIKANIPTRIAFSVSSQADSRTILDGAGAERLLGKGDMLFLENGSGKPVRIQGTFVSDDEIDRVMAHVKNVEKPQFLFERETLQLQMNESSEDELFEPACEFVSEHQVASASLLQRQFRIGYNRAARIIDEMEVRGIISSSKGSKPREVYLTKEEINEKINNRGEI